MDTFGGQVKKALMLFVILDLVFVAGALALYFLVFQPQLTGVQAERAEAIRTSVALQARVRAVEARYALTVMDVPGAKLAAADVSAQLAGLAARIPADRTQEAAEVRQLAERAALVQSAFDVDPNAARKDLEVIEAKLAAFHVRVGRTDRGVDQRTRTRKAARAGATRRLQHGEAPRGGIAGRGQATRRSRCRRD